MFSGFLLSLRESLEAALVVGIVLGALRKLERRDCVPVVWAGVAAAVAVTVAAGAVFALAGLGAVAAAEPVFEGVTLLVAAGLITWMVFWMARQARTARGTLEAGVRRVACAPGRRGVFVLTFVAVAREGIELAFFLTAASFANPGPPLVLGALGGGAVAAGLAGGVFAASIRLDLRRFFAVTGVALVLFAGGLLGKSVSELAEAGWIAAGDDPLWDTTAWLDEASAFGAAANALVGYASTPSRAQVLAQAGYLALVGAIAWRTRRTPARGFGPRPAGRAGVPRALVESVGGDAGATRCPQNARGL